MRFPFNLINSIGNTCIRFGVSSLSFDPDHFLEKASVKTGLDDFGDPYFHEGLATLIKSCKEDFKLHFIGQQSMYRVILASLINRLLLVEMGKHESEEVHLDDPVFITGIPRSGTTFLHRLMSLDRMNKTLPLWELLEPVSSRSKVKRIRQTKAKILIKNGIIPCLDKKHYTRAETPEECIVLFANTFISQMFWDMAPVFQYAAWYMDQDKEPAYSDYLMYLKYFKKINPDKRLVLKAPAHLGALSIIRKFIPRSKIIMTHRWPSTCINSVNSLQDTLSELVTSEPDREKLGRVSLAFRWNDMKRGLKFFEENRENIIHVSFKELIEDPADIIKKIYSSFNFTGDDHFTNNLKSYLQLNPRHKHGKHKYQAEDYGLTDQQINEVFTPYIHQFGEILKN